jgi:hypothetical protein
MLPFVFCCSDLLAFDFLQRRKKQTLSFFQFISLLSFSFHINPCLINMAPQAQSQLHDASKTLNEFFLHHIPPSDVRNA